MQIGDAQINLVVEPIEDPVPADTEPQLQPAEAVTSDDGHAA